MDRRRYGVIEVRRINAETYHLTIGGRMWSEVEWSRSRRAWCVQDAAGRCLLNVEHIVGQDRDPQAAIRLAKKMIVSGEMPSPEEALAQLRPRTAKRTNKRARTPVKKRQYLGELIVGDITARSKATPAAVKVSKLNSDVSNLSSDNATTTTTVTRERSRPQ
jgi:hypothetical protein